MLSITLTWPTEAIEILIACIHVVLAGLVTVNVLLKKSDVRSALGWIAAAWLSPILGSLLYYLFGINRVTRRALKLARRDGVKAKPPTHQVEPKASANIAALAEVGRRITGSPLIGGNDITIFRGGEEAYPAMLEAIAQARQAIALASYIYRNDAAGRAFNEALIKAKSRGVEVRVLLDSVGIGYFFPRAFYRLKAAGVPIARFLHTWVPWRMPFLNMRNHRKLLIVDGTKAFTGGLNIGAEYSKLMAGNAYVKDIHFKIEGPAARALMDAFFQDWCFTTSEILNRDIWWPELSEQGPVRARGLGSGPDADLYKIEMLLGAALTLARKRIRIVTPYFLPDQRLLFAIAQAAWRGVEIDLVLPARGDHLYMDWAVRAHLRFFGNIPLNIYFSPPPFDHAKLATMDGEWSLIGSSNWDARSFRLNFEYDLECYDTGFTGQLDAIIDAKIAQARKVTYRELRAAPVPVQLRDAAARLMMPYL
jgi:cardiolipin synthase A/B